MASPIGSRRGQAIRSIGALSAVGLSIVLAVIFGTAAGYAIDRWLGTSPWGFLIGFLLGMIAGLRTVFRTVAAVTRDEQH